MIAEKSKSPQDIAGVCLCAELGLTRRDADPTAGNPRLPISGFGRWQENGVGAPRPAPSRSDHGDQLAVQPVRCELVSRRFPDHQGKYREFARYRGIPEAVTPHNSLNLCRNPNQFPRARNREYFQWIREFEA
jgi:hypothetical protein